MAQKTHKYSNGEMTIVWKPDMCIHSTICWKQLGEVFKPRERPWIQPENSTTERMISQVRKCPSGALSYFMNNEQEDQKKPASAAAHIATIEVNEDGPYIINTECVIRYSDGREEVKNGSVALCRCGASKTKPYCDGSHSAAGFKG